MMDNRASILAGLLWCLALLSVVVVGTLHAAHLDLRIGKNHGDRIQAHYLAVAGMETAKALLYHDAMERRNSGLNHTGDLYDAPGHFRDVPLGRGEFRVARQDGAGESGRILYGVADEESRVNVNTAPAEMLEKLEGIDLSVAAPILAYRDELNPFRTLSELLLISGVSPMVLFGETPVRGAGMSDEPPEEKGLSQVLTVHSEVTNVNASGQPRINVQNADESTLLTVSGITSEIAQAIVSHRGQNRFESLADLLDVRVQEEESSGDDEGQDDGENGQSSSRGNSGPTVIDEDLLMRIADDLTVDRAQEQSGLININTANMTVLSCLPGIERDTAHAIISHRESHGFFENAVELLQVPGLDREVLNAVLPHVTARSETYRIVSEGKIDSTGARRRIHVVVRVGTGTVDTLFYKEET